MDCKIAGTENITGFQLDLKLKGASPPIMAEAVSRPMRPGWKFSKSMAATLPGSAHTTFPKYAPRITVLRINPEKIGLLIGPGGKNIKRLVDDSGCEIDIEDDGTVKIFSVSAEGMELAARDRGAGRRDRGQPPLFGPDRHRSGSSACSLRLFPGQDGLVHVSELSNKRVNRPEDIVKMGDEIWVKVHRCGREGPREAEPQGGDGRAR